MNNQGPQSHATDQKPVKLTKAQEDALLEEIRDRFQYASDQWDSIRTEGDKDMRYVSGDPWEPQDRKAREAAKRPVLSLDELGQHFNQVINEVRANPIAMKFDPTGNGANDKGAEFYANKAREIEYRSNAQIAYTTAFENAVQRSFGWVRVATKYEHHRSDNQDLWIEEISDPNSVLPDPDFKRPDTSDKKYLFHFETWSAKEFKRKWPEAKIVDFSAEHVRLAPQWIKSENRIQVAEYWKIKTKKRFLSLYAVTPPVPPVMPGQPPAPPAEPELVRVFEDEAAEKVPGAVFKKRLREVDYPSVCQYITNGVEILEINEWPGEYIPFAACLGKVLYLDKGNGTERVLLSMTRLARDPSMFFCYLATQQAEMAGMIPKAPVQAYEGQMAGYEEDWQKMNHEPLAFVYFKGTTQATGSQVLPPPSRIDYHAGEHLQALELVKEGARRSIQAAMGVSPLPTQAQRRNEKSGIALQKIEESGQKGSFHFVDHYHDMIRHVAVIVEDLMDKIYDTARDVGVRKPNEDAAIVRINDPAAMDPTGQPAPVNTEGDYGVTVSTGPEKDSEREAASDFADQLIQNPQVFPLIASEVVRLKNLGPIGDEIADALEVLKPPELRKQKDGQPPLPPEAQQAMAENQQLKQVLQQMQQQIETEQAKQQAMVEKARIDADKDIRIQELRNEAAIQIAMMKSAGDDGKSQRQAATTLGKVAADAEQAELDRQHEFALAMATQRPDLQDSGENAQT